MDRPPDALPTCASRVEAWVRAPQGEMGAGLRRVLLGAPSVAWTSATLLLAFTLRHAPSSVGETPPLVLLSKGADSGGPPLRIVARTMGNYPDLSWDNQRVCLSVLGPRNQADEAGGLSVFLRPGDTVVLGLETKEVKPPLSYSDYFSGSSKKRKREDNETVTLKATLAWTSWRGNPARTPPPATAEVHWTWNKTERESMPRTPWCVGGDVDVSVKPNQGINLSGSFGLHRFEMVPDDASNLEMLLQMTAKRCFGAGIKVQTGDEATGAVLEAKSPTET